MNGLVLIMLLAWLLSNMRIREWWSTKITSEKLTDCIQQTLHYRLLRSHRMREDSSFEPATEEQLAITVLISYSSRANHLSSSCIGSQSKRVVQSVDIW